MSINNNPKYVGQVIFNGNLLTSKTKYKGLFLLLSTSLNKVNTNDQTTLIAYFENNVINKEQYLVNISDPNYVENIIQTVNNYISVGDYYNAFNAYMVNLKIILDLNDRTMIIKYFNDYVMNNHTVNASVREYINTYWDKTL